jgi:ABC-type tungstate transport system substrate-binding protein
LAGRPAAEVGAIVSGNIHGFTRTLTAVALETSKGNLPRDV